MSDSLIASLEGERLRWFPEVGVGYYPVEAAPYDAGYWERYRRMDRTPAGDALTAARLQLVAGYYNGRSLVDVGIGGGRFVEEANGWGYDVNPHAVEWLKGAGRWADPYQREVDAACFWDSLEHIPDPRPLLRNVRYYAFISCPIFDGPGHVLRSKHYRRDEHCWYFTAAGLEWFMREQGFTMMEWNGMEADCGREDIGTFVFARRGDGHLR